jgi:hypothetical protein
MGSHRSPARPLACEPSQRGAHQCTSLGRAGATGRTGRAARLTFPVHPHMLRHATGYKLANDGHDTAIAGPFGQGSMQSTASSDSNWAEACSRTSAIRDALHQHFISVAFVIAPGPRVGRALQCLQWDRQRGIPQLENGRE